MAERIYGDGHNGRIYGDNHRDEDMSASEEIRDRDMVAEDEEEKGVSAAGTAGLIVGGTVVAATAAGAYVAHKTHKRMDSVNKDIADGIGRYLMGEQRPMPAIGSNPDRSPNEYEFDF